MMNMAKITSTSLARSFGVATSEITAILNEKSPRTGRNASTALDKAEINIIFEVITRRNELPSLDTFLLYAKRMKKQQIEEKRNEAIRRTEAAKAKAAEEASEKNEGAPEAGKQAEETKPETKEETPAEAKPAEEKAAEAKKEAEASQAKPEQPDKEEKKPGPEDKKPAEKAEKKEAPTKKEEPKPEAKTQQKKKKKENSVQPRTKGERKIVNTSNSVVNLGKYDDHYDELAEKRNGTNRRDDRVSNKTKVKSKQSQPQSGKKQREVKKPRKETEAERKKRLESERSTRNLEITVGEEIVVSELASLLRVTPAEVIKKLFPLGIMATVNQSVDFDTAEYVAGELGAKVTRAVEISLEEKFTDVTEDKEEDLEIRDPVVVVMGHVDHGKTSILDAIRHTAVTSTEAGGITQHIGAYRVRVGERKITFLDTPGHEAFTSMRARGAMATDVAVLVVAADDGIMPQTIEAINHAKAANVQVIVAINKMDKEGANPESIKEQLTKYDLVPEEWGGDTICVPVSAKTGDGISDLLDNIILVSDMLELKANPNRNASGVVIEARLDKTRGPIATLLVQNGTLRADDIVVAGTAWGRIRAMTNENAKKVKKAGPAVPVEIMGLDSVPNAGDTFVVATNDKGARQIAEEKRANAKQEQFNKFNKVTMDNLFSAISEGELKELSIIVKADVQGSVEAVTQNLTKLSNDEVRVKVIHGAVGAINDSDVMLASSSNAIIVGFNVRPDSIAQASAERLGVDMRMYRVIYDCIEEIEAAMKGMLAPKFREVELGKAEIRTVYTISSVGKVAGCYITEGKVERGALVRVVRDGIIVADDNIASLQRFKDAVKEVASGYECGITLEKYVDIKEGDVLEAYKMEEYTEE